MCLLFNIGIAESSNQILEKGFLLSHSLLLKTSFHFALNFNVMFPHRPLPLSCSQLVSNFSVAVVAAALPEGSGQLC